MKHDIKKLLFALFLPFTSSIIGYFYQPDAWYKNLEKPWFNPPAWIFGPVWITLFLMMGISLYLVLIQDKYVLKAVSLFVLQLIFNMLWSPIFFGFHQIYGGLIIISLLLITLIATIIEFYKISKLAALLLIPYLLWTSFAWILNYQILMLN